MKIAFRVFLLLTAGAMALFGQSAQTTGWVTDPSGSVVPRAAITITHLDTAVRREVATNDQGYYVTPALQPGRYQMTVQKEGFKPISRTGIQLLADDKVRIDFVLELGAVTETVDVAPGLAPGIHAPM